MMGAIHQLSWENIEFLTSTVQFQCQHNMPEVGDVLKHVSNLSNVSKDCEITKMRKIDALHKYKPVR